MGRLKKALTAIGLFLVSPFYGNAQIQDRAAFSAMLDGMLKHNVPELNVAQVSALDDFVFLDARSKEEYEVSHIPGAYWVGYEDFDLDRVPDLDRHKVAVVYCSIGVRSEKIARKIYESGNQNVANLYGGIFQWVDEDQPVVDENGSTIRVHAYDRVWGVWLRKGEKVY